MFANFACNDKDNDFHLNRTLFAFVGTKIYLMSQRQFTLELIKIILIEDFSFIFIFFI